ncbi:MAG: DNA-directed RNA polymerase subunit beta' [Gemmatimonadetes bacterium]|nr:DNA-directed RNA polymerase subunit beta' [Gemmatimonadota bacterium]
MIDFPRSRDSRGADFDWIQLKIASPEEIRSWSYGEVTKPETINYRSFKPERDGLFCERIFGPVKDWECHCGKFKRIRYRGHVCDRCGVEVTLSKVRRERMGHIELAVPVAHIWLFKTLPSQMGYLLGMTLRDLERIIYYAAYVVTNPARQDVQYMELLDEDEYYDLRVKAREEGDSEFRAEIGGDAVRTLLRQLDAADRKILERNLDGRGLDRLSEGLRREIASETSQQRKKKKLKRLKVVDALRTSGPTPETRNRPEWMIMDAIPVIPPDLRPLVPLDGGRFATSDLNDLYRRVINRNNRLKKLIDMRAPEVILRNEKRMLQEAVDALFDNGRRSKAIWGRGKRPLKSLSDMLKGKQGRFRQNLLGKRVDYSGRSVIVVGPELRLHQCGLPKAMAVELFKPFIIHELEKRGEAETVKRAKKIVERDDPKVYEVLEDIIKDHPVLLNRAPTLHRLGIQAFEPVLVEGKAIRIHPLVCAAFNADFDGDQMAVHVPLSFEAQLEARVLMLSSNNILLPSNGRPVAAPSQDMVIGAYYLTKPPLEIHDLERMVSDANAPKSKRAAAEERLAQLYESAPRFATYAQVDMALEHGYADFHSPCFFWWPPRSPRGGNGGRPEGKWVPTTVGRVYFNSIVPDELGFENYTMGKKELGDLIFRAYREVGLRRTTEFLDDLKDFGFRYATVGGVSVGVDDLEVPPEKAAILRDAEEQVTRFQGAYAKGVISNGERYNKVIDTWTHANNDVADAMVRRLERSKGGFNPVYMMMTSGARGNRDQMRQLAGMRGLMAKPQKKLTGGIGEIIESPIKSNFREGLSVVEYFISTHGARKGLADTALKTADAGYLTRRLVDVAQDVTVTEEDCGTILGLEMTALKEGEDIIEPLRERIVGNVALEDVYDPIDGELLVAASQLIGENAAEAIEDAGLQSVKIRSVLTCEAKRGICRQCYGRNLATMEMVDAGEAVGILAAQSIGEPGTQLTLRTFHIGGTAARIAAQTQRKSKVDGVVQHERVVTVTAPTGEKIVTSREGQLILKTKEGQVRSRLAVPYGATLHVGDGQEIQAGDLLFSWDPYAEPIVADHGGTIRFIDIAEDETMREELDESTGRRQLVIIEDREKKLHPMIEIWGEPGGKRKESAKLREFIIPVGAQLTVRDGQQVNPGDTIAKISREVYKTRDITGGLPRVAELFEARRPKDPAVITEIDGVVRFGEIKRGKREVIVVPENGPERVYEIPVGKHLRVHEGDHVRAGDRLSEGPVNPHDILRIRGPRAVQEYLLNEIQEVYRLQGVKINDKHIGVIVRQMLQKVRITDPGDSDLLEGEHVDRHVFREANQRLIQKGLTPARSEPLLLGITKASLTTESFISAASFQETTRVLTDAAVRGARDDLRGLKENIIIGHLIPAGSGIHRYQDIEFVVEKEFYEEQIQPLTREGLFPLVAPRAEETEPEEAPTAD